MTSDRPVILFVEDEPMLLELMALELADAGFEVLEAPDGDAALPILESAQRLDLLLTDIRMPGGHDGWSVARKARCARPTLPVIYATGYSADVPDPVQGAVLLRKPYTVDQITATAARLGVSGEDTAP